MQSRSDLSTIDALFSSPGRSYEVLKRFCYSIAQRRGIPPQDVEDLYHDALISVGVHYEPGTIRGSTIIVTAFLNRAHDFKKREHYRGSPLTCSLDAPVNGKEYSVGDVLSGSDASPS